MAGSLNKVMLIGNLGRDPEVRTMQNGNKVASLSLATSESWKDKQSGERREKVEWHRIAIFNERLVDVVERYCRKGDKLYVEGQLQTRKWQDQGGQDRYTTEIVLTQFRGEIGMLSGRRDGDDAGGDSGYEPASGGRTPAQATYQHDRQPSLGADLDDDIPF